MFFRKKKGRLEIIYEKELHKRDSEIQDLARKNELLLKTAMKQSASANEWKEYAQKMEKHIRRLEEEIKDLKRAKS